MDPATDAALNAAPPYDPPSYGTISHKSDPEDPSATQGGPPECTAIMPLLAFLIIFIGGFCFFVSYMQDPCRNSPYPGIC